MTWCLSLFLLLSACGSSAPPPAPAVEGPVDGRRPELQGHRGARGLHPENTLEGFAAALAIGVDTLELDTGITADGEVVVHHDIALNPATTRGPDGAFLQVPTPALHELTLDALSRYDVGRLDPNSDYATRFPEQRGRDGVRVPRLVEVLAMAERRAGGRIRYNVETKLEPDDDRTAAPDAFADAVVAVLREASVTERATIQSFDWRTLSHVRDTAPEIERVCLTVEASDDDTVQRGQPGPSRWTDGLDVDDFDGSVPRLVQAAGCAVWSPSYEDLDGGQLAEAHRLGVRVVVWTVNEPEAIDAMIELGVDGIISDRPDRVREAFERRGLDLPRRHEDRAQGRSASM